MIATHALGSCIAVCVFDPVVAVAGMLHFLLPESSINPERARAAAGGLRRHRHPAAVPDGVRVRPQQEARDRQAGRRRRDRAETTSAAFTTGRRNALAARNLLWRNGVFVSAEDVGGTDARTVHLSVADGRLQIFSGRAYKEL